MPNPIYILHLTDFHLAKDGKLFLTEDQKTSLIQNIGTFMKLKKGSSSMDIVCITGDMVDKNGDIEMGYDHTLAIDLIDNLKHKDVGIINQDSKVYCVPGNHDLYKEGAFEEFKLLRKEYIDNKYKPLFELVDKNVNKLSSYFNKYKEFVSAINANNLNSQINDSLNYFRGYDIIKIKENKSIFVSWFNTSWLCLNDKHWNEIYLGDKDAECGIIDNDKISPGYEINKTVFDAFNKLTKGEESEVVFKLSISHHSPKLLSWFDKYDFETTDKGGNKIYHDSYYSHLLNYSLVLNGHTHGLLFDDNLFLTSPCLKHQLLKTFITILEVDLVRKFVIHHYINVDKVKPSEEVEITLKDLVIDKRITTFDADDFLQKSLSNYTYEDLMSDIEWNTNDKSDPIKEANLKIEKQSLEQRKKFMSQLNNN